MSKFIKYVYMFVLLLPMDAWAGKCELKPMKNYNDNQYFYTTKDKTNGLRCGAGDCDVGTVVIISGNTDVKIGYKTITTKSEGDSNFGVAICKEVGITAGSWEQISLENMEECSTSQKNAQENITGILVVVDKKIASIRSPENHFFEQDGVVFTLSKKICKDTFTGCPIIINHEAKFVPYDMQFVSFDGVNVDQIDSAGKLKVTEPNENLVATWEYGCEITGRTYNIIARPKECIKDYDLDTNTYRCVKKGGAGGDDDTDDVVIRADDEQVMGHKPAKKGPKMSVETAKNTLKKFFDGAKGNASVWRTEEGNFNGSRLAADLTAGVVLGTVGGVVSSNIIKKNQIKSGFEVLHCTIGGQTVADWGDEFNAGLQR